MSTRSLGREAITVDTQLVPIPVHRTDGTPPIFAGFRQSWLSGEDDDTGAAFELSVGAGLGSPYLTIEVKLADGTTIHEYVDIRDLVIARVNTILAEQ